MVVATMLSPPIRIAYIRTTEEPDKSYNDTRQFLSMFIKQKRPEETIEVPRHRFLFGASNASDAHVLDIFLSDHIVPSPYRYGDMANLQRSDLELRISVAHASTGSGRRLFERCSVGGIQVVVSGADDTECEETMLQESDYIIDRWIQDGPSSWYWETARTGTPQDTVLTNPKYDMSKHDVSKWRLRNRYAGRGWTATSGAMHGNGGDWACARCGGRCKRRKCKIDPSEASLIAEWCLLPDKGSAEWRSISAADACWRMEWQRLSQSSGKEKLYSSIGSFSGE
jgi:hypothetical protein